MAVLNVSYLTKTGLHRHFLSLILTAPLSPWSSWNLMHLTLTTRQSSRLWEETQAVKSSSKKETVYVYRIKIAANFPVCGQATTTNNNNNNIKRRNCESNTTLKSIGGISHSSSKSIWNGRNHKETTNCIERSKNTSVKLLLHLWRNPGREGLFSPDYRARALWIWSLWQWQMWQCFFIQKGCSLSFARNTRHSINSTDV